MLLSSLQLHKYLLALHFNFKKKMKQQKNSKLTSLFNLKNRKVTLNKIASLYMSVKLLNFGRKKTPQWYFQNACK